MQKLLFASIFIFSFLSIQAQDTIIKRNGETILAKILEIGISDVKFKKFNFEDGPTYISDKNEIRSINFKNGQKEVFAKEEKTVQTTPDDYVSQTATQYIPSSQKIDIVGNRYMMNGRRYNEKEIQNHLLSTNDKKIMTLVGSARDAKKMQYVGFGAFPLGIAALTVLGKGLYQANSGGGNQIKVRPENAVVAVVCMAAAITCPVLSGVYKNRRANYNRAAVKLYNEKY